MKKIKRFLRIINWIMLLLAMLIFAGVDWTTNNFVYESFEQILYTVTMSAGDASSELIYSFIKEVLVTPIIIFVIIFLMFLIYFIIRNRYDFIFELKIFKKEYFVDVFRNKIVKALHFFGYFISILILILAIYKMGNDFYLWDYISSQTSKSTLFKELYVNPKDVKITFEGQKKNLIYIYLESMESTFADINSGGAYKKNYIPELTKLAEENTSFSNTEKLGGANHLTGTTWTMGALMAQTSGIPYKMLYQFAADEYKNYQKFVPGAYSLGEILEDNGYKNYIMFGSKASFGGRETYFKNHGNYTIWDYRTAMKEGIIEDGYYVFWGYEDEYLFEYAKEKITEISKKNEPFNFSMLTVDTHAPDGYLSDFCPNEDSNAYLNAIRCSSMQIYNFVKWIQKQDFYENTTIILTGDHLSMNLTAFEKLSKEYERGIYNVYINAAAIAENTNNRSFSNLDYFPTTLAAMGATIKGDRLGLGTNLFSNKKTYQEELTYEKLNSELSKTSTYYINCIHTGNC